MRKNLPDIRASTQSYEKWLASQTAIVPSDLARKHQLMRESPFVFLRGTFYRWVELWPGVCADLAATPKVTAVGDLHLENFGTWRDGDGRLIWGVNDVDEAAPLPYANDLVRLATSVALAIRERHVRLRFGDACDAILEGYSTSLGRAGEPFVLEEQHRWLRDVAVTELRDPKRFWKKMLQLPRPKRAAPPDAVLALEALLPTPRGAYALRHRTAGVGSLGRRRFVAIASWEGGWIAREAKGYVPSAASRHGASKSPAADLIQQAIRARDPLWTIHGSWVVRRLAPDCSRIEVGDLPKARDEWKLLRAMGWEAANMHLGTRRAAPAIARDLRSRRARWLEKASANMVEATVNDWNDWKR